MAELAAIIKEVAEQLVVYFAQRRLEVGWDDSLPKPIVGHLLPKPHLANSRALMSLHSFPELRNLLATLELDGMLVDESKTEEYIKSALEECIAKMNFLTHRDLWRTFGHDIKSNSQKLLLNSGPYGKEGGAFAFPPLATCNLAYRRSMAPTISHTSAERIVQYVARMIANLLRLTKNAYVQQNERVSVGSWPKDSYPNRWRSTNIAVTPREQGVRKRKINKNHSTILKLANSPSIEDSLEDCSGKSSKGDGLQTEVSSLRNKSGCTLFTRVSSESMSDPSSNINLQTDKNDDVQVKRQDGIDKHLSKIDAHDNHSDRSIYDEEEDLDRFDFPSVQKDMNHHVKFSVKHNLRNLLPATPLAKVNTNLSVHRSGSYGTPSNLSSIVTRSALRHSETNYDRGELNSFVVAHGPMRIAMDSKYADVITNKELLQQAQKYGSPNFVARPRSGYWMPKRKYHSLDSRRFTRPMKPNFHCWTNTPTSTYLSADSKRNYKAESQSPNRARLTEMSSSNTCDISGGVTLSVGQTASDDMPQSAQCSTDNLPHGDIGPGKHRSNKHASHKKRLRSSSVGQTHHSTHLTGCGFDNPENVCKVAYVTADALTSALGIPFEGLNPHLSPGVGESTQSSAKYFQQCKKPALFQYPSRATDKQANRVSSSSYNEVVYRVRIESVRHNRMKEEDSCIKFSAKNSDLLNPTPPMSIVLRGLKCSSPKLKLISAELARLGMVDGHPVIMRNTKCAARDSDKQRHTLKEPPHLKTERKPKEGFPQIDYFAVVCSTLGKIVGVEISPLIYEIKKSNYNWLIKTVTVDELEKNRKYIFHCNSWLTEDERVVECKRIRTTTIMKSAVSCPARGHTGALSSGLKPATASSRPKTELRQTNEVTEVQKIICAPRVTIISKNVPCSDDKVLSCRLLEESKEDDKQTLRSNRSLNRIDSPTRRELWLEDKLEDIGRLVSVKAVVLRERCRKILYAMKTEENGIDIQVALQTTTIAHKVQNPLLIFEKYHERIIPEMGEHVEYPPESTKRVMRLCHPKAIWNVLSYVSGSSLQSHQPSSSRETWLGHVDHLPSVDFVHSIGLHHPAEQYTVSTNARPQKQEPQIRRISPGNSSTIISQSDDILAREGDVEHNLYSETDQQHMRTLTKLRLDTEGIRMNRQVKRTCTESDAGEERILKNEDVMDFTAISRTLQIKSDDIMDGSKLDSYHSMAKIGTGDVVFPSPAKAPESGKTDSDVTGPVIPILSDSAMAERLRQIAGMDAIRPWGEKHQISCLVSDGSNIEKRKPENENVFPSRLTRTGKREPENVNSWVEQANNHCGDSQEWIDCREDSPLLSDRWMKNRKSQIQSLNNLKGQYMSGEYQMIQRSEVFPEDSVRKQLPVNAMLDLWKEPTKVTTNGVKSSISSGYERGQIQQA
ncbi:unnamed protein product [Dicrocoelium dendriticum]|nr:unnamed protein product [Dicrocoelium dendriticum]